MRHNTAWLQKRTGLSTRLTMLHSQFRTQPLSAGWELSSSQTKSGLKEEKFPLQSPEGLASSLTHSTIAPTVNSCFILWVWTSVSLTFKILMTCHWQMSGSTNSSKLENTSPTEKVEKERKEDKHFFSTVYLNDYKRNSRVPLHESWSWLH